jgi:hypothetical protein
VRRAGERADSGARRRRRTSAAVAVAAASAATTPMSAILGMRAPYPGDQWFTP